MKRQITTPKNRFRLNPFSKATLLTALWLHFMLIAQAQESVNPAGEVEIKYAGTLNGQTLFRVEFDNEGRKFSELSITDEEGTILFTQRLKQQKFSQKFLVDAVNNGDFKLIVTLSDKKGKKNQVYRVNGDVRPVYDFEVTKL